jgi:hypothetical protein
MPGWLRPAGSRRLGAVQPSEPGCCQYALFCSQYTVVVLSSHLSQTDGSDGCALRRQPLSAAWRVAGGEACGRWSMWQVELDVE